MTQIGESVAVGMIDTDEDNCPFDHDNDEPPVVENKLIGVGTTLGARMKAGSSTHLHEPLKAKQAKVFNPREIDTHPFYRKAKTVHIHTEDRASGMQYTHSYPVTCAAHHLIPAQEALQNSKLLAFMVKKGEAGTSGARKEAGQFTKGLVWANVGYDVNGVENGVYLPGSYAVGGGRGGMGVWAGNDDVPDREEENILEDVAPESNELSGRLNEISLNNRKWLYVSQAVEQAEGQFHDRHQDFSDFVGSALAKIHLNYLDLRQTFVIDGGCSACTQKMQEDAERGVPTPFGLVARLNALSGRMRGMLDGSNWVANIYTSKWGKAFMQYEVAQKKRKREDDDDEEASGAPPQKKSSLS